MIEGIFKIVWFTDFVNFLNLQSLNNFAIL